MVGRKNNNIGDNKIIIINNCVNILIFAHESMTRIPSMEKKKKEIGGNINYLHTTTLYSRVK